MKFSELAKYLERLEKTASRIKITEILAELFKKAQASEVDKITYLILGRLAPSYKNIVFNIAEKMVLRVLSNAYGTEIENVKTLYKKKGDLGDVAFALAKEQRNERTKERKDKITGELSVSKVYEKLLDVAQDEGEGSQERKTAGMAKLFSQVNPLSARFIARVPVGKLRLGFSDKTIIDALSWMKCGDKSRSKELEAAYFVLPDVGFLAGEVKRKGIEKTTSDVRPKIGIPVLPMLAQRLKSPSEMIKKMNEVSVEPKFDGLRIQIHFKKQGFGTKSSGKVKAYTRNLNENSWMFPELKSIEKYLKAKEVILDCEAIGVDRQREVLASFQTTMTRRRKHQIEKIASKISIKFYVFDILLKDGTSLMNKTYLERRKALEKVVKSGKLLEVVSYKLTKDSEVIEEMMREEIKEGLEGIIVKRADSAYVSGRTGWRWVKMKEEEGAKAKLADTIDCVVMGHYAGRGKRSGFGLGMFLAGVGKGDKFLTLTKVGTGLTDEQFRELKKRLGKLEVSKKPKEYGEVEKNLIPDVWVAPSLVVEIAADEITKSPTHSAGFALRFPRLVKFRDDKKAIQATSVSEIKKLFKLQKS